MILEIWKYTRNENLSSPRSGCLKGILSCFHGVRVSVCVCSPTLAGYGIIPEIRLCLRLEVAVVKEY